jgi:cob(I)alamin adenosyltransferase
MDFHGIVELVGVGGMLTAAGFLWKISGAFATVKTQVTEIRDNHIPHLNEDISEVKVDLRELRKFVMEKK